MAIPPPLGALYLERLSEPGRIDQARDHPLQGAGFVPDTPCDHEHLLPPSNGLEQPADGPLAAPQDIPEELLIAQIPAQGGQSGRVRGSALRAHPKELVDGGILLRARGDQTTLLRFGQGTGRGEVEPQNHFLAQDVEDVRLEGGGDRPSQFQVRLQFVLDLDLKAGIVEGALDQQDRHERQEE